MTVLIPFDKVPETLKPAYNNIAKKGNDPNLIDTEEEKTAFRVVVNHAIYTDKTIDKDIDKAIDIAVEMGYERSELYIEQPEKEESLWKKFGDIAIGVFRMCICFGI